MVIIVLVPDRRGVFGVAPARDEHQVRERQAGVGVVVHQLILDPEFVPLVKFLFPRGIVPIKRIARIAEGDVFEAVLQDSP